MEDRLLQDAPREVVDMVRNYFWTQDTEQKAERYATVRRILIQQMESLRKIKVGFDEMRSPTFDDDITFQHDDFFTLEEPDEGCYRDMFSPVKSDEDRMDHLFHSMFAKRVLNYLLPHVGSIVFLHTNNHLDEDDYIKMLQIIYWFSSECMDHYGIQTRDGPLPPKKRLTLQALRNDRARLSNLLMVWEQQSDMHKHRLDRWSDDWMEGKTKWDDSYVLDYNPESDSM